MFKTVLSLALFCTAAVAQSARIGYPPAGVNVTAGSNITVQIEVPPTLTNVDTIAIAIGLQSCPSGPCFPVSGEMGNILYSGPFTPVYGPGAHYPYENFTVQIPSSFATGKAQLGIANFYLVGAGYYPNLQLLNETINVV